MNTHGEMFKVYNAATLLDGLHEQHFLTAWNEMIRTYPAIAPKNSCILIKGLAFKDIVDEAANTCINSDASIDLPYGYSTPHDLSDENVYVLISCA